MVIAAITAIVPQGAKVTTIGAKLRQLSHARGFRACSGKLQQSRDKTGELLQKPRSVQVLDIVRAMHWSRRVNKGSFAGFAVVYCSVL